MIDLKKYSFNNYSEKYKEFFKKEKIKLQKIFPKAKIEHVGSSAVKGLGGKGIIDIAISVPKKEIKNSISELEKNGYDFREYGRIKKDIFFKK